MIETGMTLHLPRRGRPPKIKPTIAGFDNYQEAKEFMAHCAMRLELAAAMRPGNMDSDSKVLQIAEKARSIVESVARDLRAKS